MMPPFGCSQIMPTASDMRSDEELMLDVAQGDMAAFEQLVRRHQTSAWNAAFRLLRDADDAEDVAQDAFLRVLQAAGRYRPTAAFRTYLYRIVTRLCRDRRRKWRRSLLEPRHRAGVSPLSGGGRHSKEERRAVQETLDVLPVKQREAIVLRYYENLSYREIGQIIGTTAKGVERLLARGKTGARRSAGYPPWKILIFRGGFLRLVRLFFRR